MGYQYQRDWLTEEDLEEEKNHLMAQTDRQTDGQRNLETESAQSADLVRILHIGDTESLDVCK